MLKGVSVDTLHLVGLLSEEKMEEVMNLIYFNEWGGNKTFMHSLQNDAPLYKIYIKPRFATWLYTKGTYNVLIILQKEAVKQKPALIRQLLGMGEWKVKRLDLAFDWVIPMSKQFMLRNANVKLKVFKDNENYYLYGDRNEAKAAVYDKKKRLFDQYGIEIEEKHLTRLEIRVRPQLKRQTSVKDLSWLKRYLDKFVFLSDVGKVSRLLTTKEDKDAFRAVRGRNKFDWKGIGESQKQRIRNVIKDNAVDLFRLFDEHGCVKDIDWGE